MKALPVSLLAVLLAAVPAAADEVLLKNGAAFSGVVREEGERVILEMDYGTMTFKKADVREVRRGDDPLREFERRYKAASGDARSTYELALWARERGLTNRSNDLLRKVVELDPDHAEARKALGFEKVGGTWMAGDELMVARGFVKYNGRWLLKDTAEKQFENEKQIVIESDRRAAEERIAHMKREVELAKIAVERERIEAEKYKDTCSWNGWMPWRCRCGRAHFILPSAGSHGRTVPLTPPSVVPPTAPGVVPPTPPSPAGAPKP